MSLATFSPTWHPYYARNYFTLESIDKLVSYDSNTDFWYDTQGATNFPKKYSFNRTNDFEDIKVYKIITNTSSSNPTYNTNLPSKQAEFQITNLIPNTGQSAPTIDIYTQGTVYVNVSAYRSGYELYHGGSQEGYYFWSIGYDAPSVECNGIYPSYTTSIDSYDTRTKEVALKWIMGTDMTRENCDYNGDWITIETNWGGNVRYTSEDSRNNRNGTAYIMLPSEQQVKDLLSIPEIYFTDEIRYTPNYGHNEGGGGSSKLWDGEVYNTGSDGLLVRSTPYNQGWDNVIGSLRDGDTVEVYGESNGYYQLNSEGTMWAATNWIRRKS